MEQVILNETPVRTSKSFGINEIKLSEFKLPKVKEFTNIQTESEIKIKKQKDDINIKYEIEKDLTKQIINKANQNIYIEIPENKILKKAIKCEFTLTDKQNVLVDCINIKAGKNSKAEIIIKYKSDKTVKNGYHNGICNVFLGEKANIKITILNLLNNKVEHYYMMNNKLMEKSKLEHIIADFGGNRTISNYYSNIQGNEAKATLNTMYIGQNDQLIDMNYISELYGVKSNIDIEVFGALMGNSQKNFKGTIDFKKGCKKAIGNENEYCMLLSKTSKSKALPMLLCREDDVVGNHSNSAGNIDADKLYYIMSRGLSFEEARKMIVKAKFNSIIEKIQNKQIHKEIINEIDRRLV